ncbi:MAG: UDP-glucose 4-epimerase GalE [Actinomycetes bacterium]
MRILVTGGAGYIGSTAVSMLLDRGHEVHVIDDCSTGFAASVDSRAIFFQKSILNPSALDEALVGCEAVIHFAAKSLVGESVVKPEIYWETNAYGTRLLLNAMLRNGVAKLVFSSTAATYGEATDNPITEKTVTAPTNPYGASKLAADYMITAQAAAYGLAAASLRYFNVAGAIKTSHGWLAEKHNPETHLIPNLLRSSADKPMKIFGGDWPTPDGTCIRDYIHVADLIDAHIKALEILTPGKHEIINLGSGGGYSVQEVLSAAEKVIGREIPALIADRRPGDPAILVADISKAESLLKWHPQSSLETMVSDAWSSF